MKEYNIRYERPGSNVQNFSIMAAKLHTALSRAAHGKPEAPGTSYTVVSIVEHQHDFKEADRWERDGHVNVIGECRCGKRKRLRTEKKEASP